MKALNRGAWLTAAISMALMTGCGGTTDTPDSGSTCTTDSQCGTGKGCHPILKSCVASCTGSSDCPASAKTCAKVGTSTTTFCTCATDALCAMSVPGNVCQDSTKQCTAKCTSSASCPSGYTCNTGTGQCTGGGSSDAGTDAGVDAGTDAGVTVDAGMACNALTNPEPDVCGYGNVCNSSMLCEAIVPGACSNVSAHGAWTTASTGPVIFNVVDEAVDDQTKCAAFSDGGLPAPFTVSVFAYTAAGSTFPPQKSNLPGFFYYPTSGARQDIVLNLLQQSNYTLFPGNTTMGAKFTLCAATGTTQIEAGFGFTNGNPACATLTH